jgi:hypothetical protein
LRFAARSFPFVACSIKDCRQCGIPSFDQGFMVLWGMPRARTALASLP